MVLVLTSFITISIPLFKVTSAIPEPINPAPKIPKVLILPTSDDQGFFFLSVIAKKRLRNSLDTEPIINCSNFITSAS